jgi:hypothetical protein
MHLKIIKILKIYRQAIFPSWVFPTGAKHSGQTVRVGWRKSTL